MSKLHLYILAGALTLIGLGLFGYKVFVVGFPVSPKAELRSWNVEARLRFTAENKPVTVSMFVPLPEGNFAVTDEQFVSEGYGFVVNLKHGNRQARWSVRAAAGKQQLYYQATIVAARSKASYHLLKGPGAIEYDLKGPRIAAAKALIKEIKEKSADPITMVEALIKKLNRPDPDENTKKLLGQKPSFHAKTKVAVNVLTLAGIPTRMVRGIPLREAKFRITKKTPLLTWFEIYHKEKWISFDPATGASPVPSHWFRWWTGPEKLVELEGGRNLKVIFSVSPKVEEAIAGAIRRGEISTPWLLKFSLLGLPVNTQAVYRIVLLIPVGALLLVVLRNVVGIRTFGTFMPVLIALSFRETGLLKGIFLFALLIAIGLSARFYLERLKLLVVPRLAAVLIVVVGSMAVLSIVTHRMGGQTGLSVALFPMVILTMTIERMSIVWEELGPSEALTSGVGSLMTAAAAYLLMNVKLVEHLVFVFPELLLVVLAATMLLGRYTGYRLTDLYRFRELARR